MTDEEEFERVVIKRITEAGQLIGYSFAGLLKLVQTLGAVMAARRLIAPTPSNIGRFPNGMRRLFNSGLLSHSVEHAVIEFGEALSACANAVRSNFKAAKDKKAGRS